MSNIILELDVVEIKRRAELLRMAEKYFDGGFSVELSECWED